MKDVQFLYVGTQFFELCMRRCGVIQYQGKYFTGTQNTNHVPNIMQILQLPKKAYVTEMSEIPYLFFGIYLPPNPNTGTGLTGC